MCFHNGFSAIFGRFSAAAAIFLIFAVESSAAEQTNDFFAKDAALTVFDDEIRKNEASRYEILRPKKETSAADSESVAASAQAAPNQTTESPPPSEPQTITERFGDPTVDAPIIAQESAPKPFRGMMAALDAGDDKLAFQYARQYVRYMRDLEQTSKKAVVIQGLAMQKEGMLAENQWPSSQLHEAERLLLESELKKGGEGRLESERTSLNPQAKAMLQKAAALEGFIEIGDDKKQSPAQKEEAPNPQEAEYRAQARAIIQTRAPQDPKGEVDIYFFLRSKDLESIEMGRVVEKLFQRIKGNKKIVLTGLSLEKEDPDSIALYRQRSAAKFPIVNGAIFAKQLGVSAAPTIIAVAHNSGQAVNENGTRDFYYIDELIKFMAGGSY